MGRPERGEGGERSPEMGEMGGRGEEKPAMGEKEEGVVERSEIGDFD